MQVTKSGVKNATVQTTLPLMSTRSPRVSRAGGFGATQPPQNWANPGVDVD